MWKKLETEKDIHDFLLKSNGHKWRIKEKKQN